MPEVLSAMERRHQADAERQRLRGAVTLPFTPRPAPTPEQQQLAARSAAARALPDSMFDSDVEVQRLRATYESRRAVVDERSAIFRLLPVAMVDLSARVEEARENITWLALADAAAKDGNFTQARAALAALEADTALLAILCDADALVAGSPFTNTRLTDAVDHAHAALQGRLLALKLAHVDAQNETEVPQ